MMRFGALLLTFFAVGCAHIDRAQASGVNRFDVASDQEIARYALTEALGQLNDVVSVDADGRAVGHAAFASREERLTFDARVHELLAKAIYGQGPSVELVHIHCQHLMRTGWAAWPGDTARNELACRTGDTVTSIHALYRKPMLQRAYVEALLDVVGDQDLARRTRDQLAEIQREGVQGYTIVVEAWDELDGFRPRG